MGLKEQGHQQPVDVARLRDDLLVPVRGRHLRRARLQMVQRARRGQRMTPVTLPDTPGPGHVRTAAGQGQGGVVAQPVMVVDILVTQRKGNHPLCDKGLEVMLDTLGIAMIDKTGREAPGDVEQAIGFPQQQGAGVGSHPAAVEFPDNPTLSEAFKFQLR